MSATGLAPAARVAPAALVVGERDGALVLDFTGRLDAAGAGAIWTKAIAAARAGHGRPLRFGLSGLEALDTAGATLLLEAEAAHGAPAALDGADERARAVIDQARAARAALKPPPPPPPTTWREAFLGGLRVCTDGIVFLGQLAVTLATLPARARMFRRQDLLTAADNAGVRAVPLVLLLGVLIGLILAFQSLIPMRRFGADIYVANLVAISLIRELGPLLAAVILAGRSGSAFAAEIGTMKVNQEIDALTTMGLDPMTMLVLPRVLAAIAVMPAMTILLDFAGLLGMTLVLVGDGIPPVAIGHQVQAWVTSVDLYGGLFKAAVFGAAIAAIGCRAGLDTGVGPQAVGISATQAVVGGIVGAIVLDGLFAILFYRLGL